MRKRARSKRSPSTPSIIIAFINTKSGAASGGLGETLKKKLDLLLGSTDQYPKVFDLVKDKGTSKAFDLYEPDESMYIIVCGGDGSVCWVLNEIDGRVNERGPPVAVIPLGTGNDMARFLKWGSRFSIEKAEKFVSKVARADVILLDRWIAQLIPMANFSREGIDNHTYSSEMPSSNAPLPIKTTKSQSILSVVSKLPNDTYSSTVFYNYFSIGVDAEVALDFHNERNANPELFTNRFLNLFHYGRISIRKLFDKKYLFGSICDDIELVVDGLKMSREKIKKVDGLLFLNIKTYAAGMKPWSGKCRNHRNFKRSISSMEISYEDQQQSRHHYQHQRRFNHLSTEGLDFDDYAVLSAAEHHQRELENSSRRSSLSSLSSSRLRPFRPQRCDDGQLEVIGFRHYELANMKMGIQGRRLAQGKHLRLTLKKTMALEFDGEPVLAEPCVIIVNRKNQANVLAARKLWPVSAAEHSFFECC